MKFDSTTILYFVALIGIMYFVMIRPQQKQQKEQQAMLSALKKGDQVVTTGGLLGKVHEVQDKIVVVEIAQGTKVRVLKTSVTVLPEKKADDEKKADEKSDAKGET
ncbi:MAG: preprotein translocase subunit YajC [Myxococcaceae bacterium]